MDQKTFYLLIWNDEANYRNNYRLFQNKKDAMKAGIDDLSIHDIDEIVNFSFEQHMDVFNKHNIFPISNYENGQYYFSIEEITLEN